MPKVCVFGGGSFGTAMAFALACNGHDVVLLCRSDDSAESINQNHRNQKYMKEFVLPDNIRATTDLKEALDGAALIVHAVPMQASHDFLSHRKDSIPPNVPIVSVSKGIHSEKLIIMSEVFQDALGRNQPAAFLSGPSFAKEVMEKNVTCVVVASEDENVAKFVQGMFSSSFFRVYISNDVVGVELGGALKNVFAIGAGILAGLGYGNNSIAALVTRGCHELRQIASVVGGRPETLSGLSGIGDLMLTCFGSLSRNRTVGFRLGQGETLEQIINSSVEVAEGIPTTQAAQRLMEKHHLNLPIIRAIAAAINGEMTPKECVAALMMLPIMGENDSSPQLFLS